MLLNVNVFGYKGYIKLIKCLQYFILIAPTYNQKIYLQISRVYTGILMKIL